MASIGSVFLKLLLDDRDFERDVVAKGQAGGAKAGQAMGASLAAGLSNGATGIGKTLGSIGQNLTKTGTSLTRNLTLPLVAAGGAATKMALDFDTALRQTVGLTDVTQEEIAGIREELLAMGPAIGVGPQELAEAFYFVASAGFAADEAMDVLETSAKAAAAGLGETQTVAQVLGGVINAYGKENITAARAADILVEAVSQGTAEADAFAGVIGRVVPAAASMGVSFDQVAAALAGMTLTGLGAEEAAVGLNQVFISLLKPTGQAEEAMKDLGLSSAGLRRQLREEGLLATLRTLEERFAGNETASAAVFGNVRALRTVTSLLTLDSEQLNKVFGQVEDSLGRLEQGYKDTEGPQRELDRAMAELQATAIELGTDILPMVVDIVKQIAAGARELAKWWRSLDDDTKKQIVQWLAWAAVAGPVLILLGKLATVAGGLFKLIGFLAGAKGIPRLVGALKVLRTASLAALGPLGLVVAALALFADPLADAADELQDWGDATRELAELTEKDLRSVGLAVNLLAEDLGESYDTIARRILAFMKEHNASWEEAVEAVRTGKTDIEREIGEVESIYAGMPEAARQKILAGKMGITEATVEATSGMAPAVEQAVEDAAEEAALLPGEIAKKMLGSLDDLDAMMDELAETIVDSVSDAKVRASIEAQLASNLIRKGLASQSTKTRLDTLQLVEDLVGQYELLAPGALHAGSLVNPALAEAIFDNMDIAIRATEELDENILGTLSTPGAHYAAGGRNMIAFKQGIADRTGLAREAAIEAANETRGPLERLDDFSYGWGASLMDQFLAGVRSRTTAARDAAIRIGNAISGPLESFSPPREGPLRTIDRWGPNLIQTLLDGIVGMGREASQVAQQFASRIADGLTVSALPGLQSALAGALPTLGAMGVPSMVPAGAVAAVGAQGGNTTINNAWHLTVGGVPYRFETRDDFIEALDELGGFGTSDGRIG